MGPLLFLLFLNELPDIVKEDQEQASVQADHNDNSDDIVIYADNNTPLLSDKDPLRLETKVQKEADTVVKWFTKNDMIVSSDKTKLLIIGTNQNRN